MDEAASDHDEEARIGRLLEEALSAANISVAVAAQTAGCSTNTLRRMFKGKGLDLIRVLKLQEAYGFSLAGPVVQGTALPRPAPDDVVQIPVLAAPASAGAGAALAEAAEERGTVAFPRAWARQFGTPGRLRLVTIVGDSMSPDLEHGDWMLVNLDMTEIRDGIALVRRDDALLVKRLQPQGRVVLLTSTNKAYDPIPVDLKAEAESFAIIGLARWRARALP